MAIAWLAWETTTTTGTGLYTLSGQAATVDYSRFSASLVDGDSVHYIAFVDGSNWESGVGTWLSNNNQLTRDTILASTNAGNAVNWGAGTKQVRATASDLSSSADFLQIANNLSDVDVDLAALINLETKAMARATPSNIDFSIKMHPPEADSLLARLVLRVGNVSGTHVEDGAIWISGQNVVYRDSTGDRQAFLGDPTGQFPVNAVPGSIWVELAPIVPVPTRIQYIDGNGERRYLPSVQSTHADAAAVEGSIFVNSSDHQLHAILTRAEGQEWRAHADVAHSDTSHADMHGDASHDDGTHSDVNHGDSHSDSSHQDSPHSDTHSDTPHSDVNHSDSHGDFHIDQGPPIPPQEHDDLHGDTHSDGPPHGDVGHSDLHDDGTHADAGHQDTHGDTPHSDTSHDDSIHTDTHSDVAFTDVAHDDRPVNLGP